LLILQRRLILCGPDDSREISMMQARTPPQRSALGLDVRFAVSAMTSESPRSSLTGFRQWWEQRRRAHTFKVTRIPLADLQGWGFAPETGSLGHDSGRFFTVEGLRLQGDDTGTWLQPIIDQPEIGVLGILAKEFDGILHFLLQAKMEPGNLNTLQLSPTVQATRSNYQRVHRGGAVRHLEHFLGPARGTVLVDALQSEQGSWFWQKRNRNMVVEATGPIAESADFRWLTLGQILGLMRSDNLVNMDARSVLGCMTLAAPPRRDETADAFEQALVRSYDADAPTAHTTAEILSWFTEMRARCGWRARLAPLREVTGWSRTPDAIADHGRDRFDIVAVRVRAGNREVQEWTQPLLEPLSRGRAAFLTRSFAGVLHMLVQARAEPGLPGIVAMAPTVQNPAPADIPDALADGEDPFADYLHGVPASRVRFDTVLSEEGGRFLRAETRYQIVDAGPDLPPLARDTFRWLTMHQLMMLLRHESYLNIEARSLVACAHSLWSPSGKP
jgi:dTDP-4-dehydro-6-deoxy-alpha-D-glucopyranose 2,3-dehydratase